MFYLINLLLKQFKGNEFYLKWVSRIKTKSLIKSTVNLIILVESVLLTMIPNIVLSIECYTIALIGK